MYLIIEVAFGQSGLIRGGDYFISVDIIFFIALLFLFLWGEDRADLTCTL
jgi:hypothetical protein